jgi:hypothetical protein
LRKWKKFHFAKESRSDDMGHYHAEGLVNQKVKKINRN